MASRSTDPVKIMTTTETDLGALRTDLQDWFRAQAGDPELRVEDLSRNGSSGMSSVTVLFTTVQTIDGGQVRSEQVLRMEPEESALPVFMEYNLGLQARVMNLVGGNGLVPVPTVH